MPVLRIRDGYRARIVSSRMVKAYDARGNVYATTTPAELMARGIPLATDPTDAARSHSLWARQAVDVFCRLPKAGDDKIGRRHGTDGLLVGPFGDGPPFNLLIVNTDGTLAERSGNGLTIFARSLADHSLVRPGARFSLWVHHDKNDVASPTVTEAEMVVEADGSPAFWLDLGVPLFGPDAVGARGPGVRPACGGASRVARLAGLDPSWSRSVFVRIGNPHCVTFVPDVTALPEMKAMCVPALHAGLAGIAFSQAGGGNGDPCPDGVNLQWAAPVSDRRFVARVFERGEGPTASSGTSAAAIACAAWYLGLAHAGRVAVEMPGGVAPLNLAADHGALVRVQLFGTASAA